MGHHGNHFRFSAIRILLYLPQHPMPEDSSDLLCPRCQLSLTRVGTSNGVFWACNRCGGRAIGLELLRRTFTPDSINPLWLHVFRSEGSKSSPCPSCRNPMIEVALTDDTLVKVDVCRLCHFVWFDMCESDALRPRSLPEKQAPLPQKAREAIALRKIEQMAKPGGTLEQKTPAPGFSWKQILEVLDTNVRLPN